MVIVHTITKGMTEVTEALRSHRESKTPTEFKKNNNMKLVSTVVLLMKLLSASILISSVSATDDPVTEIDETFVTSEHQQERHSKKPGNECFQRLSNLLNDPTGSERIALNSFGIPNTGLLSGNIGWYGHFDACRQLQTFKYCMLSTNVNAVTLPEGTKVNQISLRWGVCVPEVCATEDILDNVGMFTEHLNSTNDVGLSGVSATVYCVEDIPYTTGFYITIGVFVVIGILMIVGTLVDVIDDVDRDTQNAHNLAEPEGTVPFNTLEKKINDSTGKALEEERRGTGEQQNDSVIKQTFLAFAINRNLAKLTAVDYGGDIDCLHGIRVIAMFWLVGLHVFTRSENEKDVFNPSEMWKMRFSFIYQMFFLNASTAVDTFLFLSGLLVCYSTLRKLEKNDGILCWPVFFIRRYLRLTPILASVMALWVFVSPHTYRGPTIGDIVDRSGCETHWWADLLYVQNFFTTFFVDQCVSVAWYLSIDMQLYFLSPIIIYSLYRSPTLGIILTCVIQLISFTITGIIVASYNLPASTIAGFTVWGFGYGDLIYNKPYVRLPPYVVGMIVGFMIHKIKDVEIISSKVVSSICWLIAMASAAGVLCVTVNHHYMDTSIGKVGDVTYQILHRFAWGVFLSWVVIYCHYVNSSGWIHNILCWKAWVPMSRLTYIVYLIHSIVLRTFLSNIGYPYYTTTFIEIFNCASLACVSYICAVFLYLSVELPVANLVQVYLPKL